MSNIKKEKEKEDILDFTKEEADIILEHYTKENGLERILTRLTEVDQDNKVKLYTFIQNKILKDFSKGKTFINPDTFNKFIDLLIKADVENYSYNSVEELKSLCTSFNGDRDLLFYKIAYHKNADNLLKRYLLNKALTSSI